MLSEDSSPTQQRIMLSSGVLTRVCENSSRLCRKIVLTHPLWKAQRPYKSSKKTTNFHLGVWEFLEPVEEDDPHTLEAKMAPNNIAIQVRLRCVSSGVWGFLEPVEENGSHTPALQGATSKKISLYVPFFGLDTIKILEPVQENGLHTPSVERHKTAL